MKTNKSKKTLQLKVKKTSASKAPVKALGCGAPCNSNGC